MAVTEDFLREVVVPAKVACWVEALSQTSHSILVTAVDMGKDTPAGVEAGTSTPTEVEEGTPITGDIEEVVEVR